MIRCLAALLIALALAGQADAAQSAAVVSSRSTVTLVSEADSHRPDAAVRFGLHFRLSPGWHIYWRNAGDAGQPPELAVEVAGGAAGPIVWPTPRKLPQGPIMTFGYLDEVLLPFSVTPSAAGDLAVTVKASWLICEHLCVPEEGEFHLSLPPGDAALSAQQDLFKRADQQTPLPSPFAATISRDGMLELAGAGLSQNAARAAWFFPGATDSVKAGSAQKLAVADGRLMLSLDRGPAFDAKGIEGVVVLTDAGGMETALAVTAQPGTVTPISGGAAAAGLIELLVGAFAGGLILNLMPCVFPVLALKAFAIAKLSGTEGSKVRIHAVDYAAGIVVSFLALGLLFVGLRAGGSAVGWGFQFQSPGFVIATGWLVFLVGLNLSGVYEVMVQPGASLAAKLSPSSRWADFATGMLAVLLATPCTAPFMGAAIAASLSGPPVEGASIFIAMGLGLASPALALAAFPALARKLPRPGRWMELLKQALAFPMYGAALWLTWVAEQQSGSAGLLTIGAGFVLLGLAGWAYGLAQTSESGWRHAGHGLAVLAVIGTIGLLATLHNAPAVPVAGQAPTADGTEPFSVKRLADLRAEGRTVFVDMTAAWCVTCLVNERVALDTDAVRGDFSRLHVVYMKGDWTRSDPAITRFLREHDRDGVPLYLLYPAGGGEPVVLPQILTESTVLDALDKAKS